MRSRSFGLVLAPVLALAACGGGDSGNKPTDAAIDGATDGAPADANCTNYTGEIIDWNANSTTFCGVYKATVTVRGQTTLTTTTNPNGRFTLCFAPTSTAVTIDVTPPTDASQCLASIGTYTHAASLTLLPTAIARGDLASVRLLSDSELTTEYSISGVGQMYVATQGQFVIHIDGTPSRVKSVSGIEGKNCAPQRQFNGTKWENVDGSAAAGTDVLYPDCPLTNQAATVTTVTLEDGRSATFTVEPNVFAYVTIPAA